MIRLDILYIQVKILGKNNWDSDFTVYSGASMSVHS